MASGARACAYDVPLALDSTLSHTRGFDPRSAMARNDEHLRDCIEHLLGSMPPEQFLDTFLPCNVPGGRKGRSQSRNAFKDVPSSWVTVDEMYAQLLPTLNKQTPKQARCPGFVFEVAATRSLYPKRPGHMKPDICCYASDNLPIIQGSDHSSRVELGYTELFIDLKPHPSHDFFVDPPPNIGPNVRHSHEFLQLAKDEDYQLILDLSRTLGQHAAFVTEILARQFRTFLFSISMSGSFARILRWDRSGCVATESFDIRQCPDLLCEFLWRFSQTSSAGRGHDSTVQLASAEEQVLFQDVLRDAVRAQLEGSDVALEEAVREHYAPGRVYAIDILHLGFTGSADKTRRYLVSRPVISPLYFVGRGTRGYWAVDGVTHTIAFLKDTWRFSSVNELEAETLQRLRNLGVRHVPRVAWYGDVCDNILNSPQVNEIEFQETGTNKVRQASWACQVNGHRVHVSRRRHHRLVLETVGYGLSSLRGAHELLYACYDVFIAMQDALKADSRIHRDISLGNIILVKVPGHAARQGYLIDWEASCTVDDVGEALEIGRAGTWRFMSIRMLSAKGDELKHTLQDDMEALFYVVLFCALMYQEHDRSPTQLKSMLKIFFDAKSLYGPGIVEGGIGKTANTMTRSFTRGLRFQSAHLGEWINTVADFLHPADFPLADSSSAEDLIADEPGDGDQDRWTDPKHLDAYWAAFLKTHKLEQNNRYVQDLPSYLEDETPSPLIFPPPPSSSLPSPSPSHNHGARTSRKRSLPVPSEDARATKRTRGSVSVPGSGGFRRSVRLEEKMQREAREMEVEKKKRKEKEATKRARAVKDKSENAKRGRKGAVGAGSTSNRSARGGSGSESTKKSSGRSTRRHRAARSA